MSFTRAAEELHVTPGAVSRQIKLLEDFLGVELFDRTNRDLRIPDASRAYAGALTDVFERVDGATLRLRSAYQEQPLHVHCAMTFAQRWLMPRLPLFLKRDPTQDIRLTTSFIPMPVSILALGDVDMSIQLGRGDWSGLVAHRIAGGELVPVCSPQLLASGPPLRKGADLAGHTLLHSLARPDDWRDWLSAAGADEVNAGHGLRFGSSSLAYQAAADGIGVAIGQMALVAEDLKRGHLVPALDFVFQNGNAYYLTYLERAEKNPRLMAFRDWILDEAGRSAETYRFPVGQGSGAGPAIQPDMTD
ncbi:LysR substrate-binding domain-containing protein [Bosea sp. (in: a-proteobacteria)]|uniref:LysR substrate-binding domain-containing protein n=1 Tax=Bosea sp. (in: a-proteobacteria) TaxID=1871050 RepID=UPI002637DF37|nr:LysR substrate-binding domain-containing protein [Bosea sp. (in: a-proteobacteria)]MCO5090229.1 LysR substrate-binding domain-containing protein [Bosea sp. (in: a-proteobacteria)]